MGQNERHHFRAFLLLQRSDYYRIPVACAADVVRSYCRTKLCAKIIWNLIFQCFDCITGFPYVLCRIITKESQCIYKAVGQNQSKRSILSRVVYEPKFAQHMVVLEITMVYHQQSPKPHLQFSCVALFTSIMN